MGADGVKIVFDAETQAAFKKVQDFVAGISGEFEKITVAANKVNQQQAFPPIIAGLNNLKKTAEEAGAEEGGIFGKLFEVAQVGEFVAGLGAAAVALITIEKIWETLKAAAKTYVEQVNEAINRGEEIGRLAERSGLAVESVAALRKMAIDTRVTWAELSVGMGMLNDHMFMAARLGGQAGRAFRDLGVDIFNADGSLRSTEEVLPRIMDAFQKMPDGPQKVGLAMEMFGRSARDWIPLLNEGSDALEKMKATGGISPSFTSNAHEFNVAMRELRDSINDIWNEVAAALLPVLIELAAWLKNLTADEQAHHAIVTALIGVFQLFAASVLILKTQLEEIWDLFKASNSLGFGVLLDAITAAIQVFDDLKRTVVDALRALVDLAEANTKVATILSETASGKLSEAWRNTRSLVSGLAADLRNLSGDAAAATDHIGDFFENAFRRAANAAESFVESQNSLNSGLAAIFGIGQPGTAGSGGSSSKAGASGGVPGVSLLSEEGKRLIQEIDKQFAEATQNRLALLDEEEAKLKKKLDEEIPNQQEREEEKLKVTRIYAAKRLQEIAKEQDEANAIALSRIKNQQASVTGNTEITEVEKAQQLIPLLQQELSLDQQQLEILRARSTDPRLNDEARLNAQKQMIALEGQELALQRQLKDTQGGLTWAGQFQASLISIQNQWGTWASQMANNFKGVFNGAVSSISQGITGIIMKTETWRQALSNIATSIMGSIIQAIVQMGVQWVATQILIAVTGKSIAAASTATTAPIAAVQSAIWAVPATLATIASYGGAAAAAPGLIALAEGITLADSAAAFAEGGLISGPTFSLMGEAGPEFVMRREALEHYGLNFMSALNQKKITNPASDAAQASGFGGAVAGGSGSGGVNVQGHQMSLAILRDHSEMKQFLQSAEGEAHIVKIARKNRLKIGIPT